MGFIYKITNKVNGKAYVGKTIYTVEQRFKEHLRESKHEWVMARPLYRAMNKYGTENFIVEMLEEVADRTLLDERERYWIAYYDTVRHGYNATLGGDGRLGVDRKMICDKYLAGDMNMKELAAELGCCQRTVLMA